MRICLLLALAVAAQALPTKRAASHFPHEAKMLRLKGGSPSSLYPLLAKSTVFNTVIGLLGVEVGKLACLSLTNKKSHRYLFLGKC